MKIIFLFFTLVYAQVPSDQTTSKPVMLYREGQIFSIKISPQNPVKIFIVGKEEATIDLSDFNIVAHRLNPGPKKLLNSSREGDHFILNDSLDFKAPTDLEFTTKTHGKTEKFKFRIENKLR